MSFYRIAEFYQAVVAEKALEHFNGQKFRNHVLEIQYWEEGTDDQTFSASSKLLEIEVQSPLFPNRGWGSLPKTQYTEISHEEQPVLSPSPVDGEKVNIDEDDTVQTQDNTADNREKFQRSEINTQQRRDSTFTVFFIFQVPRTAAQKVSRSEVYGWSSAETADGAGLDVSSGNILSLVPRDVPNLGDDKSDRSTHLFAGGMPNECPHFPRRFLATSVSG